MIAGILPDDNRRQWCTAIGVALAAHLAIGALVISRSRPLDEPVPDPVVLLELPPMAAPAPVPAAAAAEPQVRPDPRPLNQQPPVPPIAAPPSRAPVPQDAITLPAAPPQPAGAAPAATPAPAAAPAPAAPQAAVAVSSPMSGDPRAKKSELDYFSLVAAHLNRRKTYPTEAKKARQEGVVTVRFTIDRAGDLTGATIKRSSGFDLLDQATLALLRRVAPLPRMPAAMQRDSVTISVPIEYSLKSS